MGRQTIELNITEVKEGGKVKEKAKDQMTDEMFKENEK